MNRILVLEKIKKLVVHRFGADPKMVTLETFLVRDLKIQVLDLLDLLFEMRKSFGYSTNLVRHIQEGHFTGEGMAHFARLSPSLRPVVKETRTRELLGKMTVLTLVEIVEALSVEEAESGTA